jgi:Protein of unknown function (DUF3530)
MRMNLASELQFKAIIRNKSGENMKNLLIFMVFLVQFLAIPGHASDYAREKKWADEIVPGLVVGDPVYLKQTNNHKFLTLYTPVKDAKSAVILVHGMGVHPDWGHIGVQRVSLADAGYTTLSVQMPVLKNEAKEQDYLTTFPEARERLKLAIDFLKSKGYASIAIESHSLGSWMTYTYLVDHPDPAVRAWVASGVGANVDFSKLKLPVLDLYGENDFPQVLKYGPRRKKALSGKPGSMQQMIPGADHFYTGADDELLAVVTDYLKANFK